MAIDPLDVGPSTIPIPGSGSLERRMNALAGPSSEGAIQRRPSRGVTPSPPRTPSSAPPTPSVISVTHPSPFIHIHHPRRGSMTPLGLNLISPISPFVTREPSTARQTGFSPNNASDPAVAMTATMGRRGSATSTTSTLTQSRPAPQGQLVYPLNWNPSRRRSSLTPSVPTLAAASPTRAHVSGRVSRPTSSEGHPSSSRSRTRTAEAALGRSDPSPPDTAVDMYGRRGSMPHLGHARHHQQARWNPVLPPSRGSVGDDGQIGDGFRFGSGHNAVAGPSSATAALRALDHSPHSQTSSIRRRPSRDAFQETEDEEADRQRRAFLAATYGEDGRRARERLSIGGGSAHSASPGAASTTVRRQSLMLWERMGMAALGAGDDAAPLTAPLSSVSSIAAEDLGPRRGSLPIAIPGGGLGRTPSRRSAREAQVDPPSLVVGCDTTPPDETEEENSEDEETDENNLSAPSRPLPPLLPLSDPGPRLLPSTLALHRANHLLASRNLQSEPLPHPLPPSLHPPAPVDVAEFDIDFILAGSSAQLGQGKKLRNGAIESLRGSDSPGMPFTPTLRIGADEEDTFAKFVGEFDDEYGGRRGEWTFRVCATPSIQPSERSPRDPLDVSGSTRPAPKAEWESSGAGKYEIFANGEVRSAATGRSWRVGRRGAREYELEEVRAQPVGDPGSLSLGGDRYCLASKGIHRDSGGVKVPHLSTGSWTSSARSSTSNPPTSFSNRVRNSISDASRTSRFDSADSAMTMTPQSMSLPIKKPAAERSDRSRSSVDKPSKSKLSSNKEPDSENKKDRSLGGVFKRGLQSIKSSGLGGSQSADEKRSAREERERERQQAHSWAGVTSFNHASWSHGIKPLDRQMARAPAPERSASTSAHTSSTHSASSGSSHESRGGIVWYDAEALGHGSGSSRDDVVMSRWREGVAWKGVPDDAVAMIIPLDAPTPSSQRPALVSAGKAHPFFADGPKQVLLVWYVPFNSDGDDSEQRPSSASSRASTSEQVPVQLSSSPAGNGSGSLPKFQKLLRRRASKDKEALKRDTASSQQSPARSSRQSQAPALPFRSFRVVARVVDAAELCSELVSSGSASDSVAESSSASSPFDKWQKDQSPFGTVPLPSAGRTSSAPQGLSAVDELPSGPSAAKSEATGRNFPTVIAVCHSRAQGVEFVLEGLDRLGLCKGESAWGPTGYEEWRGTGLSEQGRELLDLLWAGFTPLLLAKALTLSFLNPFRRAAAARDGDNGGGAITVQVKWGRERYNVPIPSPALTPLSTLLATLSSQTYLPLDQLKLIYKGAVLKDPSLTIASYGIAGGSTLVLVGKGGDAPSAPSGTTPSSTGAGAGAGGVAKKKAKQPETTSEPVLVAWIAQLVSSLLDPLKPSIVTFISHTSPSATNRPAHTPPFEALQKEHARLSEMLLKALLELDGVDIPSGWGEARKERKEGVRNIQGELNRVDEAWGERKRIGG